MNRYPVVIHSIHIAPEHRLFGKGEGDVSGNDLLPKTVANLIADSGIEGDRFCRLRPDYNGHVTFFSQEVWDEVSSTLDLPQTMGPERTRRNIILSGVDLKALYGKPFVIQNIHFLGTVHCAPCLGMNRVLGKGAREAMRSRGGLRAQLKSNGTLSCGPCDLFTQAQFDPKNAGRPLPKPKIP